MFVLRGGPCSREQIIAELGIPAPALNVAIRDLANDRLVSEAKRGGQVLVDLTTAGRSLLKKKEEEARETLDQILSDREAKKNVLRQVAFSELWKKAPKELRNNRGRKLLMDRIDHILAQEA